MFIKLLLNLLKKKLTEDSDVFQKSVKFEIKPIDLSNNSQFFHLFVSINLTMQRLPQNFIKKGFRSISYCLRNYTSNKRDINKCTKPSIIKQSCYF